MIPLGRRAEREAGGFKWNSTFLSLKINISDLRLKV